MRKIKILVVCAQAVATSTVVKIKAEKLCKELGISFDVKQCRAVEFRSRAPVLKPDLILHTCPVPDVGIPTISAMPYLTGINTADLDKKVAEAIKTILGNENTEEAD